MSLELQDVSVSYGSTAAVAGVSLGIGQAERVALLGPSGSGKSTLLRAIAGLEPLTSGRIGWAGADLASVPVHQRHFGLMFQEYVLFPQRTVRANVAFGLEMANQPRPAVEARVTEVLALVGLAGYEERPITQLSGGEQQRVALARALAPTPRLLMLDEPLGALDRALRARLLEDLAEIFDTLRLPILYVTHDQEEALAIADRVAIMNAGRLEALAPPGELWANPATEFVARFLGFNNIVEYERISPDLASTRWGNVPLPADAPAAGLLVIRPDGALPDEQGSLAGTVTSSTFRGDHTRLRVAVHGESMEVDVRGTPPPTGADLSLRVERGGVIILRPSRASGVT